MKSSVDLTENRDFRKDLIIFRKTFKQMIGDFQYNHDRMLEPDQYLNDNGYFYQGNKNERATKKLVNQFNDMQTCDRCGSYIAPYDNETLCRFCRKDIYYSFVRDNIFWITE